MNSSALPLFLSLSDIYPLSSLSYQQTRYTTLQSDYNNLYKSDPTFIARAPGRVNLIGEHIDYMGYGVLPFALEQDTLIAFEVIEEPVLQINHINSSKYPSITLSNDPEEMVFDKKAYYNYLLAGYRSVLIPLNIKKPKGIRMLVTGDVPIAAGLSSSAAMVVCGAVMTAFANNLETQINLSNFAENTIEFERKLGTAVGGMDQTISIMGKHQKALYIEFNPIRTQEVKLPEEISFIIGNSLTLSEKLLSVGTHYNKRVCECRLALLALQKSCGIKEKLRNLHDLQNVLKLNFSELISLVKKTLKSDGYTQSELETLLETPLSKTLNDISHWDLVLEQNKLFYLQERAIHVYAEAERVLQFKEICEQNIDNTRKAIVLGELMDKSHESCKTLYDCSSEKLDLFVAIAKKYGALGSRLTGAGWGGCTVSMVKANEADVFLEKLSKEFYGLEFGVHEAVFKSQTGIGAGALLIKKKE